MACRVVGQGALPGVGEVPTVLLVEDNDTLRGCLARVLRGAEPQLEVLEASGLGAAREVLSATPGKPSLLIVDQILPDGTGTQLWAELEGQHGPLLAVLMTGDPSRLALAASTQRRPYAFLAKPFEPREIVALVRRALQLEAPGVAGARRADHAEVGSGKSRGLPSAELGEAESPWLALSGADVSRLRGLFGRLHGCARGLAAELGHMVEAGGPSADAVSDYVRLLVDTLQELATIVPQAGVGPAKGGEESQAK